MKKILNSRVFFEWSQAIGFGCILISIFGWLAILFSGESVSPLLKMVIMGCSSVSLASLALDHLVNKND